MGRFVTFFLLFGGSAVAATDSSSATFNRDVLPILQKNCQTCHRPGLGLPFRATSLCATDALTRHVPGLSPRSAADTTNAWRPLPLRLSSRSCRNVDAVSVRWSPRDVVMRISSGSLGRTGSQTHPATVAQSAVSSQPSGKLPRTTNSRSGVVETGAVQHVTGTWHAGLPAASSNSAL